MGFFKTLKGKVDVGTNSSSQDNSAYSSLGNHDDLTTHSEKRRLFGGGERGNEERSSSDPSSGPVLTSGPTSSTTSKQPLPAYQDTTYEPFAPPLGPPPSSQSHSKNNTYEAPPGPPPPHSTSTNADPPPYHDWTSVPDTSTFPPPPAFSSEYSPANNASEQAAEAAHMWCDRHPPYAPAAPSQQIQDASSRADFTLERPPTLARNAELTSVGQGKFRCKTRKGQQDALLLTTIPVYYAAAQHPLHTEIPKTIYFEVEVKDIRDTQSGIAIGFAAKPYPAWRLPGWHRASIGVHGDDGRRYVNDSWGGREFVRPFQAGDIVGIGMRFIAEPKSDVTVKTRAFFTRNGREEGSWNVDEERDSEREEYEGIQGLEGDMDMYGAVGFFGGVDFEVKFRREDFQFLL